MENNGVAISKSRIHGLGLFARRDFKSGEIVYEYKKGKIISEKEIEKLSPEDQLHLDKVGEGKYEVIGPPGCYVNHSCEPNIKENDHKGFAVRDIKNGEELTADYDEYKLDEPLRCDCGSGRCKLAVSGKK